MKSAPRVFVVEGYLQNGGTYMAYHLGRLCHELFGRQVYVVGSVLPALRYFAYPYEFPVMSVDEMERAISDDDLLVCNPSFSRHLFGLRLPGRKLCYVQGVTTFEVLDGFYGRYVFASEFAKEFVAHYYKLDGPVIHPFINHPLFRGTVAWTDRKDDVLCLVHRPIAEGLLRGLEGAYRARYGDPSVRFDTCGRIPQEALARRMGAHKYYVTLSPMEGFGLPALEAMASGCTVVGFDGWGGREYFRHGVNAMVTEYPRLGTVAEYLHEVINDAEKAQLLAANGRAEAQRFEQRRFDEKWAEVLGGLM